MPLDVAPLDLVGPPVAAEPPSGALDLPLNQLWTFLMVARRRSFTRAAAELHLTQPAVSAHIHKLELAIGGTLFEQIGRRISLTATGQVSAATPSDSWRSCRRSRPSSRRPHGRPQRQLRRPG